MAKVNQGKDKDKAISIKQPLYVILRAYTTSELEQWVIVSIEDGYFPMGGVLFIPGVERLGNQAEYAQAMILLSTPS